MGLLQDIQQVNEQARPNQCVIYQILDEMTETDRTDLEAALEDATITHVAIARVLHQREYPVGTHGKSVAAHRRGQCGCARR